jgi:hypothetical protein
MTMVFAGPWVWVAYLAYVLYAVIGFVLWRQTWRIIAAVGLFGLVLMTILTLVLGLLLTAWFPSAMVVILQEMVTSAFFAAVGVGIGWVVQRLRNSPTASPQTGEDRAPSAPGTDPKP